MKISIEDIKNYVEENIGTFHNARIESLAKLKLNKILERKNPYLFKAKNILTPELLVRTLLDAHLSSQEESMFGDFLEKVAIYINEKTFEGWKSGIPGIDLEFNREGVRYIVAIKSGPHWGNSSQILKLKNQFDSAVKTIHTTGSTIPVIAINGCCYGRDNNYLKNGYQKLCGQRFWTFISGKDALYTEIIEPLGYKTKEKNDEFYEAYNEIVITFTAEFIREFCIEEKKVDWNKIVELNSATEKPKVVKKKMIKTSKTTTVVETET